MMTSSSANEPITQPEATSGTGDSWPTHVSLVDVTPRDGLQDAPSSISTEEKLQFIALLIAAGVRKIEATSFMRASWIPQLADADAVAAALPRAEGVTYSGLVPNMRGYERARAAHLDEIVLVVSASESHNRANLNRSVDESLAQLREVAQAAHADGIQVCGAVATAFGCPFEGEVSLSSVMHVVDAYLDMGVQALHLSDSIGTGNPRIISDAFTTVRRQAPAEVQLGAHLHDRAGLALANVYAAFRAGATSFDGAVGGLGGCPYAPGAPGNLATSALVTLFESMGYSTGISLPALYEAQDYVMSALAHGTPVTDSHSMRLAPQPS